ncbi:hypothetical protein [Massilia sp. YIM B02443]|uniref:hypothetical protein n=1 Tax=Massilia sp. YIM B02443 TaxID=3050127 RepID=UPI0025B72754|nr:hypothetical protein [Massilia sp. YIM B02443]MDN4038858.1 hypothetical protein [Massilia sp. YIM B02443]
MVTSIGGASATQAAYATRSVTSTQTAAGAEDTSAAVTQEVADSGAQVATLSDESAAAARLGDQLSAQADAARVQRAVDESTATATDSGETTETLEATDTAETQAAAPASGGGAPMAAGGATAASTTTDTDYIEEADTNSDKTVSDQERAVYDAKQRRQAEETAAKEQASATDPAEARSAEVRSAYGLDGEAAPALDITA